MKKIVIIIILVILVVTVAIMAPPITSKSISSVVPISKPSPIPTPEPTPIVKIDINSNLSQEAKKLNVPDYQSDYSSLDQTLSGF